MHHIYIAHTQHTQIMLWNKIYSSVKKVSILAWQISSQEFEQLASSCSQYLHFKDIYDRWNLCYFPIHYNKLQYYSLNFWKRNFYGVRRALKITLSVLLYVRPYVRINVSSLIEYRSNIVHLISWLLFSRFYAIK